MKQTTPRPRRPRGVTFLAIGVLSIAGFYTARMLLAFSQWEELSGFEGVSAGTIAFTGLAWAVCAWPVGWGLWRGKTWAPRLARMAALLYSIYYWLELVIQTTRQVGRLSMPIYTPFAGVVNLLCVILIVWTLNRNTVRAFFGDFNGRSF